MITLIRTVTAKPGKQPEAMAFAREIANVAQGIIDTEIKVWLPVGGNIGEIAWVSNYSNLAQLEEATQKLFQDEKYIEMLRKADLFVEGSGYDRIWRELS